MLNILLEIGSNCWIFMGGLASFNDNWVWGAKSEVKAVRI
jgi:hypothetical protein